MNLTNGLNMWEMTYIFFKYVGNDVDLWEMAQICFEMA